MIANRKKSVLLVGILMLSGTFLGGCPPQTECPTQLGIVLFPDDNLETAVRMELGQPFGPITSLDMQELTYLNASNLLVRNLEGIQYASRLLWLDLSNDQRVANTISNVSQLSCLLNLTFLNLANNDVTDVTPLGGLFELDQLHLSGNPVVNITPLVANAEAGGLGPQDTLTLERAPLIDDEGQTSTFIAQQLDRLVELGVDVVLVDTTG